MGAGLALRFGKAPCATMDELGREAVERLIDYYCRTYDTAPPRTLARVGTLVS